nr:MAG TPA: hypothetical protein [Caudoviricetes sp.]
MFSKASRSVLEGITPLQATLPYRKAIHALYASLRACNRYFGIYQHLAVYTHRTASHFYMRTMHYPMLSVSFVLRMYPYLHVPASTCAS